MEINIDPIQATERSWTFMVYLAGDNNLEHFALKDLAEMKRAGSTPQVAIVAQLDGLSDRSTRRYFLQQNTSLPQDCLATLPEVNTGDPIALFNFIEWATQTFPAEHYGLILWNHGAGWKDDDIYQAAQKAGQSGKVIDKMISRAGVRRSRRALFRPTLEKVVDGHLRAILFDDTSADFLDNIELKQVLQKAVSILRRPLDLLGFDACLMSMLEVQYQVRTCSQVMVGSQEIEPGDGWPYEGILRKLVIDPGMSAAHLGSLIVNEYLESYRQNLPPAGVTQSAVNCRLLDPLAASVSQLANVLQNGLAHSEDWPTPVDDLISTVQRQALRFRDQDYFDLADICRQLSDLDPGGPASQAANGVLDVLNGVDSPVVKAGSQGDSKAGACGISVYLPARWLSPLYQTLDFAQEQSWDNFLKTLIPPDKVNE